MAYNSYFYEYIPPESLSQVYCYPFRSVRKHSDASHRKLNRRHPWRRRRLQLMTTQIANLPSYSDLPVKTGAPAGSAWGLFGEDDQIGCLNLLTPRRVIAAAKLVRKGAVFPLNLSIDQPDPPLFGRGAPRVEFVTGEVH